MVSMGSVREGQQAGRPTCVAACGSIRLWQAEPLSLCCSTSMLCLCYQIQPVVSLPKASGNSRQLSSIKTQQLAQASSAVLLTVMSPVGMPMEFLTATSDTMASSRALISACDSSLNVRQLHKPVDLSQLRAHAEQGRVHAEQGQMLDAVYSCVRPSDSVMPHTCSLSTCSRAVGQ